MKHLQQFENVFDNIPEEKLGVLVFVYRSALGDSSANGITSKVEKIILVGEDIHQKYRVKDDEIYLELKTRNDYTYAVPIGEAGRKPHVYMNGGNFVYSSDGAFPFQHPIPVHDRYESHT